MGMVNLSVILALLQWTSAVVLNSDKSSMQWNSPTTTAETHLSETVKDSASVNMSSPSTAVSFPVHGWFFPPGGLSNPDILGPEISTNEPITEESTDARGSEIGGHAVSGHKIDGTTTTPTPIPIKIGFDIIPLGPPISTYTTTPSFEDDDLSHQCTETEAPETTVTEEICNTVQVPWSCRGRCGESTQLPCSCEATCVIAKTCCSDFTTECVGVSAKAREIRARFPDMLAVCDPRLRGMVVTECPAWATPEEKQMCAASGSSRLRDDVPVSDSLYHLHFRNTHCWNCWQTTNEPIPWTVTMSVNYKIKPSQAYNLHAYLDFMESHPGYVTWSPPEAMAKWECSDMAISACPDCAAGKHIVSECEEGMFSYLKIRDQLYKNHYCYLCNNNNTSGGREQTCLAPDTFDSLPLHDMNFPITMVFPANNNDKVQLTQDSHVLGSYSWNVLTCSEMDSACQAEECSEFAFLENGVCDPNLRPFYIAVRMCSANVSLNYEAECKTGQNFQEMFGSDLDEIKTWIETTVREAVSPYIQSHKVGIIESRVYNEEKAGLTVIITGKGKMTFWTVIPDMYKKIMFLSQNNLHASKAVGPLIFCVYSVDRGLIRIEQFENDKNVCFLTYACGRLSETHFSVRETSLSSKFTPMAALVISLSALSLASL